MMSDNVVVLPSKPLEPLPEHLEIAQAMLASADEGQIQVSWVHAVAMAMTTEYHRGLSERPAVTATQPELMKLADAWVEADAMWENAAHRGTTSEQQDAEEKANAAKTAFATALSAQAAEIAEAEDMAIADQKIIANLTAEVTKQAARLAAAEAVTTNQIKELTAEIERLRTREIAAEARAATMREALAEIERYAADLAEKSVNRKSEFMTIANTAQQAHRRAAAIRTTDESPAASGGE